MTLKSWLTPQLRHEHFRTGTENWKSHLPWKVNTISYYQFCNCSPYSEFKVGAAIRLANGSISTGCNIENSSYSPSICAERTAACKAISEGHHEFKAIAVVAYQEKSFTTPCGVCRQFLDEFTTKDVPVYVAKPSPHQVLVTSIGSLLPMGFVAELPPSK